MKKLLTTHEQEIFMLLYEKGALSTRATRTKLIGNKVQYFIEFLSTMNRSKEKENLSNICKEFKNGKISFTKYVEIIEESMKKNNFPVLSYEKVVNILNSLNGIGLITKRHDPSKNAKYLWVVNPNYLLALEESKT